ncbi:MAG: hypothetical protein CME62_15155 [Halobacteriovoraceae bacterium]|nr:hypothetical protein [Halobacteriovoraceae bacterium]|tara:strand:+ start:5236 stop:6600 length:1365 start_codon:yes stop_codon:yes gene_type:complete
MNALMISKQIQVSLEYKKSFEANYVGLKVSIVQSEEEALEYFVNNPDIAFFILDVEYTDKIDNLLSKLIDLSGKRPIVLFGSSEKLQKVSKRELIKNEENYVITSSDENDKIKEVIMNAIAWYQKKFRDLSSLAANDRDYLPMKLRNLYFFERSPNDLYVKISDHRYMLTFEKDAPLAEYQIRKLSQRRIKILYIDKDRHIKFLEESMEQAMLFFKQSKELNKKVITAHLRSTALLQDYIVNVGVTDEVNKFIDALIDHICLVFEKEMTLKKLTEEYQYTFKSNISRSLLSAYFCFFLIRAMGWRSLTVKRKFIFASLIQDAFVDNDELSRVRTEDELVEDNFTVEERANYPEHPRQIAELARQFIQFPDVDFLLEHHHELPNRNGFPATPSPSEMQMAVCLFNTASNFARDVDGLPFKLANLQKVFKYYYSKKFNVGNFKEPIAQLKKIVMLS